MVLIILIIIHPYYVARSETVDSLRKINHSGNKVRVKPEIKALFVFLSFKVKPGASPALELWSWAKVLKSHFVFHLCRKSNSPGEERASGGARRSPPPASSPARKFHLFPSAGGCGCDHRSTCLSAYSATGTLSSPGEKRTTLPMTGGTKQGVGRQDGRRGGGCWVRLRRC